MWYCSLGTTTRAITLCPCIWTPWTTPYWEPTYRPVKVIQLPMVSAWTTYCKLLYWLHCFCDSSHTVVIHYATKLVCSALLNQTSLLYIIELKWFSSFLTHWGLFFIIEPNMPVLHYWTRHVCSTLLTQTCLTFSFWTEKVCSSLMNQTRSVLHYLTKQGLFIII